MILKFFTFLLICYLLYRFIGFFFKAFLILLGQRKTTQHRQRQRSGRPRTEGSIHVEYEPSKEKKKQMQFRGGEYVDYEEVDK